ncbi:MAG: hypothetical protein PHF84_10075 [bacterium]|nr:hypothetical protein [bacterium]
MKLILMAVSLMLTAGNLLGFSVNPGIFEIDCKAGNKVNLQYELRCTKSVSEFIKVDYENISGLIDTNHLQFPKQEIRLEPNGEAYKLNILVRTPVQASPENILKISFYDVPKGKSTISISTRISTRAYIRYTDEAKVRFQVENLGLKTLVNRGQTIHYLVATVKNEGNTYIKPRGTIRLTDAKGRDYQYEMNELGLPVYSNKSRELETVINSLPEPGLYEAVIESDLKITEKQSSTLKIKITDDHKILIMDRKK